MFQELFRLVSRYDMESFPTNATYLSDNLQPLPYTPFAAMIAKQQNNYATSTDKDNRTTDTYSIGVLGKNSVKEVSSDFCFYSFLFLQSKLLNKKKQNILLHRVVVYS